MIYPCYLNLKTHSNDSAGNSNLINSTFLVSIPVPSGGSSSSGNSGGAGTTTPTTSTESNTFVKVTPEKISIMKISDKEIGIKEIKIQVKDEIKNVKITISKYENKPSAVSVKKTGNVYQYIHIETKNLEKNLEKATLKIKVKKSWVSDRGLGKDNISLFKFDNTSKKWNELKTTYKEDDDNNYYYDVELTSFSYFAISEKVIVPKKQKEKIKKIIEAPKKTSKDIFFENSVKKLKNILTWLKTNSKNLLEIINQNLLKELIITFILVIFIAGYLIIAKSREFLFSNPKQFIEIIAYELSKKKDLIKKIFLK